MELFPPRAVEPEMAVLRLRRVRVPEGGEPGRGHGTTRW